MLLAQRRVEPMNATGAISVTGGAGFIGSNFVHAWLEEAGGRIISLSVSTSARNFNEVHMNSLQRVAFQG